MILPFLPLLPGLALDVPVDPDGDQARQWIIDELSKPEYQAAKPTWWDLLFTSFWDWFTSLDLTGGGALQTPLLTALIVVVAAAIITAFIIFGRPRRNRRSAIIGSLFGQDENRDAAALRRAASAAAAERNWTLAIEELFRALARMLAERVLVTTDPGTTAHGFAARASAVFPDSATQLDEGADAFDAVRYLGRDGTEPAYEALVALERTLRTAHPAHAEGGGGHAGAGAVVDTATGATR
ncbi:hypothetical protein BKA04_000850 [Cryobacterium mesophilum]|uniref:DUF4129 domain-containing protein n=1 Tax=Terrimesophilobacter mesophilus TaxID=433647 RepID=A0A4R8VBF9_9MICO|nr:DUF4129 domain-containing protein [Terrimesophilobacter mesophilus]MBB5632627.1 hypothetical protein [Terrimesophilobacter mesophilus]TFB79440.1 DUF4129 domain-containing protein [Terrimesophilobacter mesophilus]